MRIEDIDDYADWYRKHASGFCYFAYPDEVQRVIDEVFEGELFKRKDYYLCSDEGRPIPPKNMCYEWFPRRFDLSEFTQLAEVGSYDFTSFSIGSEEINPWESIENKKREERLVSSDKGRSVRKSHFSSIFYTVLGMPCIDKMNTMITKHCEHPLISPGMVSISYEFINWKTQELVRHETYYNLYKVLRRKMRKLCFIPTYVIADGVPLLDQKTDCWASQRIANDYKEKGLPLFYAPVE